MQGSRMIVNAYVNSKVVERLDQGRSDDDDDDDSDDEEEEELSPYEKARAEKIKQNMEVLMALGLA